MFGLLDWLKLGAGAVVGGAVIFGAMSLYDATIDGGRIDVTMTLTTQGCPLHDAMTEWVRQAIARIPGVETVNVSIVFDPPWTPDRIRQDALL